MAVCIGMVFMEMVNVSDSPWVWRQAMLLERRINIIKFGYQFLSRLCAISPAWRNWCSSHHTHLGPLSPTALQAIAAINDRWSVLFIWNLSRIPSFIRPLCSAWLADQINCLSARGLVEYYSDTWVLQRQGFLYVPERTALLRVIPGQYWSSRSPWHFPGMHLFRKCGYDM